MLSAKELITLTPQGDNSYSSQHILDNGTGTMFGGQLLALSLAAAQREAPDWPVHSLSGNFLRSSRLDMPLELAVSRTSDSRRFASRHVLATQQGQAIFEALCSFHEPEPGIHYQQPFDAGAIAPPESLPNLSQFAVANAEHFSAQSMKFYTLPFPVEMRLLEPESLLARKRSPQRSFWFRIAAAESLDDAKEHQSLLALMSDYWLPSTGSALPAAAGVEGGLMVLSLNHSMRFHAAARVDKWLLYRTETTWAANSRALAHGEIYDADFQLIASVSQEYLLRQIGSKR